MQSPDIHIAHREIKVGATFQDSGELYLIDDILRNANLIKLLKITDPNKRLCEVEYARPAKAGMERVQIEPQSYFSTQYNAWQVGSKYGNLGTLEVILNFDTRVLQFTQDDGEYSVYKLGEADKLYQLNAIDPFAPKNDPTRLNLSYATCSKTGRKLWEHHELYYPKAPVSFLKTYEFAGHSAWGDPKHYVYGIDEFTSFMLEGKYYSLNTPINSFWKEAIWIDGSYDWLKVEHPELFPEPPPTTLPVSTSPITIVQPAKRGITA